MQLLIASTSTVFGQPYLQYMASQVQSFFPNRSRILFIPYARPAGTTYDEYTKKATDTFINWNYQMRSVHSFASGAEALDWAQGVFTGGGNTFLLLKTLYDTGLFPLLDQKVRAGLRYFGTSAGSNIAGISIGTTNDMPITYPPSLQAFGWLPFNLNPHYLDPIAGSTHMGETRATRIAEFHHFNPQPVIGLREGSWLQVKGDSITLKGPHTARWFTPQKDAIELQTESPVPSK